MTYKLEHLEINPGHAGMFGSNDFTRVTATTGSRRFVYTKLYIALRRIFMAWPMPESASPETRMCYRILEQAIIDATNDNCTLPYEFEDKNDALDYLRKDSILACEDCGVDSLWVQEQLRWAGVDV